MAGFCELAASLQAPILGIPRANSPQSPAALRKIPVFERLQPEIGFDLHCAADAAVFWLSKIPLLAKIGRGCV
jgi:hypothetical protein